jgi:hypothetical protein
MKAVQLSFTKQVANPAVGAAGQLASLRNGYPLVVG